MHWKLLQAALSSDGFAQLTRTLLGADDVRPTILNSTSDPALALLEQEAVFLGTKAFGLRSRPCARDRQHL